MAARTMSFTAHEGAEGVGLLRARQRIEQLGGHPEVRSHGGQGTRVPTGLPLRIEAVRLGETLS